MPYVVFEAVGDDGAQPGPEDAVIPGEGASTRAVGTFASWAEALIAIARLEAGDGGGHRSGGFALGIRSEPPVA